MVERPSKNASCRLPGERPEHVIGLLLKCLHHSLRQSMELALREAGVDISFAHFATLFTLHEEPGLTGAQLARRAMVSPQTMNAILRRLETDACIERRPHPESRRADSWHTTAAGAQALRRARVVGDAVFARMLAALDAGEIEQLQSHLRRCIAALERGPGQRPHGTRRRRRSAAGSLRQSEPPDPGQLDRGA